MITVIGADITLEQLHQVEVKEPANVGGRWQGFQHGQLVCIIMDEIRARGWKINDMQFAMSKDEADLAGAFALSIPKIESIAGQDYSLGFLTSNAQRRALKMVVGTRVACCCNGMVTGEIILNLKHTRTNEAFLIDEISNASARYLNKAQEIPLMINRMRERELGKEEASELLLEAGRLKLLPWARIGCVDQEYRHPTFGEHGKNNSWALLNAFTHIVKEQNPLNQMDRMNRFRELLPLAELAA
jgi:hypothetical protein